MSVTLGSDRDRVESRLRSGQYQTASEVIRAGLRALDREDAALEEILRRKVEAALSDPRTSASAADVFGRLRAHHSEQEKADKRGA
jgi:antitoxin ParD1/3/4